MSLEAARFQDAIQPGNAVIIFNPEAGTMSPHKKSLYVDRAEDRMIEHGWRVSVRRTKYKGHEAKLAERAVKNEADVILHAGGDGGPKHMLPVLAYSETALGILPLGTVKLWARETGITGSPENAVDMQLAGGVRQMDVGTLNDKHYFRDAAGLNFDGAIADSIDRLRTKNGKRILRGAPSYFAAACVQYPITEPTEAVLTVDGESHHTSLFQAWVGNTRLLGFMELRPEGRVDDGSLDVTVFPKLSIPSFIKNAAPALTRHFLSLSGNRAPGAVYYQGATTRVETERPVYAQLDGEVVSPNNVHTFKTLPGALRTLVPDTEKARSLFSQAV